jgi:hypothetical protein
MKVTLDTRVLLGRKEMRAWHFDFVMYKDRGSLAQGHLTNT